MLIPDDSEIVNLNMKLLSIFVRRWAKTIGYILIIEEDVDALIIDRKISKP